MFVAMCFVHEDKGVVKPVIVYIVSKLQPDPISEL